MSQTVVFQWLAVGFGGLTAFFSLWAAATKTQLLKAMPAKSLDGDKLYQLGPNEFLYDPAGKRGKLNAAAVVFGILTALFQILALVATKT